MAWSNVAAGCSSHAYSSTKTLNWSFRYRGRTQTPRGERAPDAVEGLHNVLAPIAGEGLTVGEKDLPRGPARNGQEKPIGVFRTKVRGRQLLPVEDVCLPVGARLQDQGGSMRPRF
jgi:hypothetical protein